jgi:hypothetical protein
LDCIENDLKLMSVKRRRRREAEERSVWAVILKEALVKLEGPYAKEEVDSIGHCEKKISYKYVSNSELFSR